MHRQNHIKFEIRTLKYTMRVAEFFWWNTSRPSQCQVVCTLAQWSQIWIPLGAWPYCSSFKSGWRLSLVCVVEMRVGTEGATLHIQSSSASRLLLQVNLCQ